MSALVRITIGVMPQHSRVGMSRAMAQFGEVVHCHKPPYSGIPGEDFVNVRFANQDAADRAYAALKTGQVFVDGFPVGVGAAPKPQERDGMGNIIGPGTGGKGGKGGKGGPQALQDMRRRSESPPRRYGRNQYGQNRPRSPPPRKEYERPYERRMDRDRSPQRRGGGQETRANFPSRNDEKSASPRRMARDMHMKVRDRSRSRSKHDRRFKEDAAPMRLQDRERTPSPELVGPAKNVAPVKNPFFRQDRSPSPDLREPFKNTTAVKNPFFQAAEPELQEPSKNMTSVKNPFFQGGDDY